MYNRHITACNGSKYGHGKTPGLVPNLISLFGAVRELTVIMQPQGAALKCDDDGNGDDDDDDISFQCFLK